MENQKHIKIDFKARYYTQGELSENTEYIWLVFHGYGQLGKFFIRNFNGLSEKHFVIAPEGLSRFYLSESSGRVGASWMTSEDRLTDIENQNNFINSVYKEVYPNIKSGARLVLLGFSQGTATALRWLVKNNIKPSKLLLWAGTIPTDLSAENETINLSDICTFKIQGRTDPYLKSSYMKNMEYWMDLYKIKPQEVSFDGGHTIDVETLNRIVSSF